MARLCPYRPPRPAMTPGEHAEQGVLDTLEQGLSNAYTLLHNVDWARADGHHEVHGELDIVAINLAGDVLLIEVKSGALEQRAQGLFKVYTHRESDVRLQCNTQHGAVRSRLKHAQLSAVQVGHLLVVPDAHISGGSLQWPPERVVDSSGMPDLVTRVRQALGPGQPNPAQAARVLAFFENRQALTVDVSALAGRLQNSVAHLADGLATWVPRIQAPSGLVRVQGTAGSGKTQLALRLLRAATASGQRAAYLCFNRVLADHMARLVPTTVVAETFHERAHRLALNAGLVLDFSVPDAFQQMTTHALQAMQAQPPDLDLLVLDEVQDLQPEWVEALLGRLKAAGRAYLLEDEDQRLYDDRQAFDLPDAVTVRSRENFRSPRCLVELINLLHLVPTPVQALSPLEGELADPVVYTTGPDQAGSAAAVVAATAQAVQRCLDRGFALADIAVVSLQGRTRSALLNHDSLAGWTLRRFTGAYDDGGAPQWSEGELLADTVRRFKGQAAPAVVLTECDLPDLQGQNARLLFVGLTRARLHLEWVVSTGFAQRLQAHIRSTEG